MTASHPRTPWNILGLLDLFGDDLFFPLHYLEHLLTLLKTCTQAR